MEDLKNKIDALEVQIIDLVYALQLAGDFIEKFADMDGDEPNYALSLVGHIDLILESQDGN